MMDDGHLPPLPRQKSGNRFRVTTRAQDVSTLFCSSATKVDGTETAKVVCFKKDSVAFCVVEKKTRSVLQLRRKPKLRHGFGIAPKVVYCRLDSFCGL